ncbi:MULTISPECIES: metalloregulator ArsR/SmtB family transcription factor [unclassified Wenzhouxiangella]|uniref:ArsR/SmtB family transcription factor n=1 Tax=unclassified Wenzhouxiangella TaxID=2613841 RepID=UPI000E32A76F|nr:MULTISPECIES: metalloregulator ArsR/SmtB family transcription factor [unclassified Wenzhouxiangella]RFF28384.1 ArsR family transcriptional regulator [Wenzhouxiangella sp. 15181]RFP69900.1 ArsR family transcriptional regulator [Wenzhouxiangella sp. 15190]
MTTQQDLLDTLAQVARGLGNGHRLALLERMAQAEASVDTLASTTGLTVGNASQHLQQLRRAGLVTASRSGKQMIYRLTDERIITVLSLLRQVAETNLAEMERLVSRLFSDDDADGALETVSQSELLAGLESGEVALLDVRPVEEFQAGHLPEAINIPLEQLEAMLEKLPRDKQIVAYCRGPYCALSHEAVQRLRELGYRVRRFEEGFPEWKAAGLPIQ